MNKTSEQVAKILLSIKAVSFNPQRPYKYASGILSPVYTDCRVLIAYPDKRRAIRDLYIEAIQKSGVKFDVVAGTATAGIPHAAWIADKLNLPMVYVRGSAKDHGKENLLEGVIKKGQQALVVEDLVSTGESAINSTNVVRKAGGKVSHVFAIITYGIQIADDNFKKNNLTLVSLTTFSDVLAMAEKIGQISPSEKAVIAEWAKDPQSWGKKHTRLV